MIRRNIDDVKETMLIGIFLAFLVVYLFLGNLRSTIITGMAIPDSILGAFCLMYIFGFTINMMTLLALSLTIGLLVDDAIVVRENIFRKLEAGMHPIKAAEHGTKEVMLAVIATTLTIIAVFMPIGFLQGIVGRFFKQFGLTVVFAMLISLFDALTVAPLLSAYFAGKGGKADNIVVRTFDRFQDWLDRVYGKVMAFSLDHPLIIIAVTLLVFVSSLKACGAVKKTFQPDPDEGEYMVNIKMPPETSLDGTYAVIKKISDKLIKNIPELNLMTIQAGSDLDEHNRGSLGVFMVPRTERKKTTNELKQEIRALLAEFKYAEPTVDFYTRVSGGGTNKPFILNLQGDDLDQLYNIAQKIIIELKKVPDLTEITTSFEEGKPEFQVIMDGQKMIMFDVAPRTAGAELRYQVEGAIAGKFHDKGLEYNVRVRLKPEQRELHQTYNETAVPNMMSPPRLIPLKSIADGVDKLGLSTITRQNRTRVIQIFANISTGGAIGTAIDRTKELLSGPIPLPRGVTYSFVGQADAYQDMVVNIIVAFVLSLIFIYLVLTSLYESFFTPITIYLALPPAMSGAFFALYITGKNLDMFSMIGCIMLLGLVTKNSILLVDFALEGVRSGLSRKEAITKAGLIRLRPILMTTFAMIAGTIPVAFGVGEAAKYRTGMGVGIIGGLVLSTLITLVMVPAVFEYIDKFREFVESKFRPEPEEDSCLGKAEECEIVESMHSNKVEKMFHMADSEPENKKPRAKKKKQV